MGWLLSKGRRYISILAPVIVVVPAVLCIGWTNAWHDYTPSEVLPDVFVSAGLDALDDGVQRVFAQGDLGDSPSILDYPVSNLQLRRIFTSRSAPLAGLDWRLFRDELAVHEIDLRSDPDEMTNIQLAARSVDGVVVRPFEVFSFNDCVGERSEERGFRPGLMFSDGEVVSGMGGGICIVSTGVYNAAVRAGYKIIERAHHSGPVRYAEPGLDSAVVFGALDLSFKNDTIAPVMIRAKVKDDKLIVSLRGRKRPGFEVEIEKVGYKEYPFKVTETEDPSIPEGMVEVKVKARTGFEVTTVRVIKQDGKVTRREVLSHDCIPARDKVVLIPPKPEETEQPEEQPAAEVPVEVKNDVQTPKPAPVIEPKPSPVPQSGMTIELDELPEESSQQH